MDSTNECTWVRRHLDDYLTENLELEHSTRVSAHIDACDECEQALAGANAFKRRLKTAVAAQGIPPDLSRSIRARLETESRRTSFYWQPLAAAAALVIVTVGVWLGARDTAPPRDVATVSSNFVEVGLAHDVHCASARPEPAGQLSLDELVARMDSEYGAALVPAVAGSLKDGMRLVDAHRCRYRERQFLHLVMRDAEARVSLLVTDSAGLELTQIPGGEIVAIADQELFRLKRNGSDLTATRVGDRMLYVVSDSARADSIKMASALVPVSRTVLET